MPGFRTRRLVDALTLGPRRRRRSMDRQLAELDRLEFGAQPLPPEPRSRALMAFVVVGVAVVGLLSVWLLSGSHPRSQPLVAAAGEANVTGPQTEIAPRILGAPTHTHVDQPRRLLPAVTVDGAGGSAPYRLLAGSHGPRWEPCRSIHYVTRHGSEGAEFDALFRSAVREVSAATGLRFVDDGPTPELPQLDPSDRLPYQPQVYGDRWAPVLVAWSNAAESPQLAGAVEGFAGPLTFGADIEPPRYVSGVVTFDVEKLRALSRETGGGIDNVRTVLLHELGHLVGLAHNRDRSQVMYREVSPTSPAHYGADDRAGLAYVGRGPCYTDF